jgi:hypothetical protein
MPRSWHILFFSLFLCTAALVEPATVEHSFNVIYLPSIPLSSLGELVRAFYSVP